MISNLVPTKIVTQLEELIKDKIVDNYYLSSNVNEYYDQYNRLIGSSYNNLRKIFIDGIVHEYLSLETSNGITKLTKKMTINDLFNTTLDSKQTILKGIFEQGKELRELRDLKLNLDKLKDYIKT